MSGFSEAIMRERLQRLTNTAHSIQTLSLWIIHHQQKHADMILNTWLKEMKDNTSSERLICLTNLANDVIQNCRKKHPEFMRNFYDVLQPAFCYISEIGNEQCRKIVNRILDVWRERMVYSTEELNTLKQCLDGPDGLSSPSVNLETMEPRTPPTVIHSPPTTSSGDTNSKQKMRQEFKNFQRLSTSLVGIMKKIEEPASADAKIRQLIAGYPESIANPALLKQLKTREEAQDLMEKIKEAHPIVNAYCGRLKAELDDRKQTQKLLDEYLVALGESSARNNRLILSVRKKITRIDDEKKDMAKHIESLPDLSEMFTETASSSLPSLGELFT